MVQVFEGTTGIDVKKVLGPLQINSINILMLCRRKLSSRVTISKSVCPKTCSGESLMDQEELSTKAPRYWQKTISTSTAVPSTHTLEYAPPIPCCQCHTNPGEGLPRRDDLDWYLRH